MTLISAQKKLRAAIADVPAHIDERLVEINTRDVLEVITAIKGQSLATSDPEQLGDLETGSNGAAGRSAYIKAECVRFLLAHFDPPAPAPADPS